MKTALELLKEYMQWRKGKVPHIEDQAKEAILELAARVEALEAKKDKQ